MIELPHRFVPTTSKFVSPVRIVTQTGHRSAITALAFSRCRRFLAATDAEPILKIWNLDNLDVIGSYRLDFIPTNLQWSDAHSILCSDDDSHSFTVSFDEPTDAEGDEQQPATTMTGGYIPLLGAPEFSFDHEKLTVTRSDDAFTYECPGIFAARMETCERYVAALSPKRALICDTNTQNIIASLELNADDQWKTMLLDTYGNYIVIISKHTLWQFDPIREKPQKVLASTKAITATDDDGANHIAFGDENGNIAFYDVASRAVLLRTPRFARSFETVFPSPELPGLIALRDQSTTAFLGQSQEILTSAPLPAPLSAACPANRYSELLAACTDCTVYRLKLDSNNINKLCVTHAPLDVIACSGEYFLAHDTAGHFAYYNGAVLRSLDIPSTRPRALAINETATIAAILGDDELILWDIHTNSQLQAIHAPGARTIAFGKDKTADSIYIFDDQLQILTAGPSSNQLTLLNTLDEPALKSAKILSAAPAAKSFLFLLCEISHGQLAIVRVGLNSGKFSIVLRVFAVGTQIWGAAFNEHSVLLRDDASCLRIVQGLTTFSVDDWSRSEPLAIF